LGGAAEDVDGVRAGLHANEDFSGGAKPCWTGCSHAFKHGARLRGGELPWLFTKGCCRQRRNDAGFAITPGLQVADLLNMNVVTAAAIEDDDTGVVACSAAEDLLYAEMHYRLQQVACRQ